MACSGKEKMRIPGLFVCATLGVLLAGCGGATEQTGATDLYGAYDVIDKGMSVAQLKAVIGVEPLGSQPDGDRARLPTWETDANT